MLENILKKTNSLALALVFTGFLCAESRAVNWERVGELLSTSKEQLRWRSYRRSGTDIKGGEVDGLVHAPYESCLTLLRDYSQYRGFLPFFTGSRELSREGGRAKIALKAKIMKGLVNLRSTVSAEESAYENGRRFDLKQLSGNLGHFEVSWILIPLSDNQTVVRMRLLLDPDLMLVPDSTISNYNLVNGRRTIRAIRERLKNAAASP